jgi:hypothetical protein
MVSLHHTLFVAAALYLFICLLWGLALVVGRRPISPAYRGTLRLAEGLLLAQAVVGLLVFFTVRHPAQVLHLAYGLVILLALPAAETFGPQWWKGRRETLVVTLGCLFALGLAVRAAMTG